MARIARVDWILKQPMVASLPELRSGNLEVSRVRIPPTMDVPITPRVRRLLDSAPMRRLASLSQLGLVSLVYPGATHSRLEHSLGVYANAVSLLRRLQDQGRQSEVADPVAQQAFLVAALVHDAGHWPFCHPIEDMGNALDYCDEGPIMKHEARVDAMLTDGPLASCLAKDWDCSADDVSAILCPNTIGRRRRLQISPSSISFYASCLSGPIDIDKLDYLQRDSLHAGVPYGRNFDAERLIGSLVQHPHEPRLAINEKGRTAAEMMVFGRYVMFSEVYWHHTVRAATAMLQRVIFELHYAGHHEHAVQGKSIDVRHWANDDDQQWIERLRTAARESQDVTMIQLVEGLFGPTRQLLKRVAQFNAESGDSIHSMLARKPYNWLVGCSNYLTNRMNDVLTKPLPSSLVLIDAPPVKLEVDINIDVIDRSDRSMKLGDVSPVASVLANRQFDNHVKRVRVFVPESVRSELRRSTDDLNGLISRWLLEVVNDDFGSMEF
ncbi:HD domain-containing protein [Neorhodopirellula pilleata]|uniref:Deoxyguanosinetriphosphate triphosphohydrolase-like protein n=1 Tax=Neorhodopirellula pilleata TaxID=2714738 RepID=A0A5C5ZKR9_9BACT|nr:HD domain-containing protein [Neorhodopirellula pilleata]TWT87830.1 Deoxyguanosinetriphosphate triphosphohydrolase-like protein [Neorhodopirellula pilleata]